MFRLNETIKKYKEVQKKRAGEIDYGSDESVKKMKKQTPGQSVEESKDTPPREYDYEGEMTKQQLRTIEMAAQELQGMISDNQNLPEWWQNKVTLAADYMQTARDYMKSDVKEGISGTTDAPKGPESYEAQYKRRVVKTTDPEHKEKGYDYRIKGKKNNSMTKKLYKNKPSQAEFNKQMRRIAGHEFG